jgi:hypothetical protein
VTASPLAQERVESRIPALLAVIVVGALVLLLPSRYQLGPSWLKFIAPALIVAAMAAVSLFPRSVLLHRIERIVVLVLVIVVGGLNVAAVWRLVADMITHKHGYSAITLLESAAVIWTINVLVFAMLYWQLDRGGPEARASDVRCIPDFHFAEAHDEASGWEPHFTDYLFLAFAASTAFAAPDYTRPVTRRAKLIVMFQAIISLVTLFLIASRAIASLS